MDQRIRTKDIAQRLCQALGNRDLDVLLALFAEEVDWYIPGCEEIAPWTGRRGNKREIREFFSLLWKNTEPVSAFIDRIIAEERFAVVTGEFSTRMLATKKVVDSMFSIHLTVKDDLIVKYRLQEDSFAVVTALQ